MNSDPPDAAIAPSSHPKEITPVLKVENLTVYQGTYAAVEDVSFELPVGTNTAIVGPNGAGKSTLVQAILGLLPFEGAVQILGCPLSRLGNLRYQIGYIPQNFVFDRGFPLSVSELVGLGWVDHNLSNSAQLPVFPQWRITLPWKTNPRKAPAIAQAMERVDIYHLRNRAIGNLSGGQLKRVLLAHCLVMSRRLLVLDEALAGVDLQGEADFYTLLNQLKREHGWTVLQVSHDLDMVSHHCDRVLCLNRRLVCQGQPEEALSPQNLLDAYGPSFSRYQHHH
ncbi:metal ABC transporter ATP-binding protein [Oculatella sp. FACHB-28]|uniref:metal ABC transporter ATP-binding protein n=1 Tax=Oculatella sp. FACHB-28 TaxID=2692845 RepID=UPI00168640AD|nr:metal ABC transporter ATP-binding protein [Oculatella sp. FACHB-28]MBD2059945.1 metal ABC transporter ATP-binding protein [Oculatella sp. FACHB-28]